MVPVPGVKVQCPKRERWRLFHVLHIEVSLRHRLTPLAAAKRPALSTPEESYRLREHGRSFWIARRDRA